MVKSNPPPARPTLWRTCRVLANRRRLRMLHLLMCEPDQPVSEVAKSLKVPVAIASEYLRALNARGLLSARRVSRWVRYSVAPDESLPQSRLLLDALRGMFETEKEPVEAIFRFATAFTHPRREEIYRALSQRALTLRQLLETTGIPRIALKRHLTKLQRRGFVSLDNGTYRWTIPNSELAKAFCRLAWSDGD